MLLTFMSAVMKRSFASSPGEQEKGGIEMVETQVMLVIEVLGTAHLLLDQH